MGAGLVGIDVISGLLHSRKSISLVEIKGHMLSIQLDKKAASSYEEKFKEYGVRQYYEKGVKEFIVDSEVETDKFGLLIDSFGKTNCEDIYGVGDVTGRNPIWSIATKEGIIAASNMALVKFEVTDFFASKSTMNFLEIPTMSLGINEPLDETYKVEIECNENGNYKKIIHKGGKQTNEK